MDYEEIYQKMKQQGFSDEVAEDTATYFEGMPETLLIGFMKEARNEQV